jgi:hypothetical protein
LFYFLVCARAREYLHNAILVASALQQAGASEFLSPGTTSNGAGGHFCHYLGACWKEAHDIAPILMRYSKARHRTASCAEAKI